MKIIINNTKFDFNVGCRLLKSKYRQCPEQFENQLGDMWDDIQPMTFKEIAKDIENIEQRRIAIGCLGIENVIKEVKPKLINKQTLKKQTTWINQDGILETKKFNDVYELYEVNGTDLLGDSNSNSWMKYHFVKFNCTSTNREYMIWVDKSSVERTNEVYTWNEDVKKLDATMAIAWTITTNIAKGSIDKIVRQGDCILIKTKNNPELHRPTFGGNSRHLTKEEYLQLLVAES